MRWMPKRLDRRIFLRGLGGACVAAPFLGSLGSRSVKAQSEAPPRRLIAMFTHCGCITTRFFPQGSHGPLSAADLEPTTLKHLAPYVGKMLVPRGIRAMNEWTTTMVRGQGNDSHLQACASYLTCQPVAPNSNDPFSFDSATKFNAKAVGPSLDHVIAEQLSPSGTPLFMRVGNFSESAFSNISYSAAETPYPGLGVPSQVFSSLTGLFGGGSVSPDSYQAARGRSVLDLVKDDLDTLERFDMSQSDQRKLEAWKELLHQTQGMIPAQCTQETADALLVTQDNVDAFQNQSSTGDPLTRSITSGLDGADLYSSLAVLAALCNANPVIVLKYPGSYVFQGLGVDIDTYSLAGRVGSASLTGTCVDGVIDQILKIDDYHTRKFARLVDLLDSIDEGDVKLLDNTATVWFQEVSDGCARNLNNLPIIQVGGAGGYFKTGWVVNVEDGAPDLTRGNSEIVCAPGTSTRVDATTQNTGTDPSLANAPINKYYVSLMNALGVKAGSDGFPQKGGSEEVTKFGMYDKTEDFVGGGSNPPTIHSPGGFDALKANA